MRRLTTETQREEKHSPQRQEDHKVHEGKNLLLCFFVSFVTLWLFPVFLCVLCVPVVKVSCLLSRNPRAAQLSVDHMTTPDHLYRFLFEDANVRGEIVHLDDAYQGVVGRREYPPVVRDLLGRALAAAALLSSSIKFRGSLSLQVQGKGEEGLTLLVVQVNTHGGMRAVARWRGELPQAATLGEMCPNGYLAITIDPDEGDSYQGIVALEGDSLQHALDNYFQNSEQLATRVWLVADEQRAAGMLLQRLPGPSSDDDAWNRAEVLAETITDDELLHLNAPAIIRRLYHEEDIRLFDPVPFHFQCTCSRERVGEVLRSLGHDEMQDILQEQGQVEVHCDFCNEGYRYDPVDIEQLFVAVDAAPDVPTTRH